MNSQAIHPTEHTIHVGTGVYLIVGAFLIVLTAMEITVTYIHAIRPVMVPVLLVLAAAKFILIAAFFMHLKYEKLLLNTMFLFPLFIATFLLLALFGLFGYLSHHMGLAMPLQSFSTMFR